MFYEAWSILTKNTKEGRMTFTEHRMHMMQIHANMRVFKGRANSMFVCVFDV